MSDYYNLLTDTLRSGHLQVEKIYNRLNSIYNDKDRCVNIRTGYPMKIRDFDTDYVYPSDWRYKICFHFDKVGRDFDVSVYERLLKKYEDWLDDYSFNKDNEKIKLLIETEKEIAKSEPDYIREKCTKKADFFDKFLHIDSESYSYISNEGSHQSSFIQDDNEVILINERKIKYFKKSLGKKKNRLEKMKKNNKLNQISTNKKLRKIRKKSSEFDYSNEMEYIDIDCLKSNQKKKKKILLDDDDEAEDFSKNTISLPLFYDTSKYNQLNPSKLDLKKKF